MPGGIRREDEIDKEEIYRSSLRGRNNFLYESTKIRKKFLESRKRKWRHWKRYIILKEGKLQIKTRLRETGFQSNKSDTQANIPL
jgi:23S rRNA G2445 N2-methylase RlmL